ncbi:hypothetical protein A3D77_06445 [Candidatus Gottesmanbacteria bacterium RIFCSPHIGHO2_02_FULL_39_11]|uniref:DUF304 domain-containing protein n=1 Tax=Candidatus Gottesmanbacteria bacterium RIFCSPHIGHO2_02_FULL_39_11 TaxID=1798382 RepID=A0A1F5ZXJ6_9BACT|nr:MAG: hypothetical protein A3D77_06445 [Candidatus Gottesmanbacteria bacterium RIFCSPHIGHO2_02_FULL_39_11]
MYRILDQKEIETFMNLPGEELLFANRQHFLILISPIVTIAALTILFFSLVFILSIFRVIAPLTSILLCLTISFLAVSLVMKSIYDWYNRIYIVTTRKILDISLSPFSDIIDEVLLDQVQITEIDVKIKNIIFEFLNLGDIIIRFDSPSHEGLFVLSNLASPQEIGMFLGDKLETVMSNSPIWFRRRNRAVDVFRSGETPRKEYKNIQGIV